MKENLKAKGHSYFKVCSRKRNEEDQIEQTGKMRQTQLALDLAERSLKSFKDHG